MEREDIVVHSGSFDKIYRNVPPEQRERLRRFRADHPYRRLTVHGVDWDYIAGGQGEQALLILGGGLATGETSYEHILRAEAEYRVVSPSYPPVGGLGPLADGLVALLDAEGIGRAHVFGHSLGAAAGHVLIRRHPERVGKLVLSSFGLYNERNTRQARRLLLLFRLLPLRLVIAYYKGRMGKLLEGIDEGERQFYLAYILDVLEHQHTKRTLMGQFELMADLIERADAYHVREPVDGAGRVLILQAEDDTGFAPDEQAALRATYPGAEAHLFPSGGHLAGATRREEFQAALYGFLRG